MLMKNIQTKNIGVFLGKLRKHINKEITWEKTVNRKGEIRYKVNVPNYDVSFNLTLVNTGALIQISEVDYRFNNKKVKELEEKLRSLDIKKQDKDDLSK